jgi:hypothetical protein
MMKIKFNCNTMDEAGALHNALLDYVAVPEGMETKAKLVFGGGGHGLDNGWGVEFEEQQIPCLADAQKKAPLDGEA